MTSQRDYITKIQYGVTYEGRPLYAMKICKNDGNPVVYVDSLTHSREWVTTAAAMYTFHQVSERFVDGKYIKDAKQCHISLENVLETISI